VGLRSAFAPSTSDRIGGTRRFRGFRRHGPAFTQPPEHGALCVVPARARRLLLLPERSLPLLGVSVRGRLPLVVLYTGISLFAGALEGGR
jgi:hypothetical protein